MSPSLLADLQLTDEGFPLGVPIVTSTPVNR